MKDYLIRGIDKSGKIRMFVANTTNMVEKAREVHGTSATASAAMGRTMTAASMMGLMMKNPTDSLTLQVVGNGPLGSIVVSADSQGNVKGYVHNPKADLPNNSQGKLDVAGVVGKSGYLSVTMDLGLKDPYVGQSSIVSGEIAEDIAAYYAYSEQQPSAVSLGVLVEKDLSIRAAGGFIIQLLPGVSEEDIMEIEKILENIEPVSKLIDRGLTPEEIMEETLGIFEMELLDKSEVAFVCDCNKERIIRTIKSLNSEEIQSMIDEDGGAEVVCHFCNKAENLSVEELEQIIIDKQK